MWDMYALTGKQNVRNNLVFLVMYVVCMSAITVIAHVANVKKKEDKNQVDYEGCWT